MQSSTFLDGGTKEAEVVFTESELKEVLGISEFIQLIIHTIQL